MCIGIPATIDPTGLYEHGRRDRSIPCNSPTTETGSHIHIFAQRERGDLMPDVTTATACRHGLTIQNCGTSESCAVPPGDLGGLVEDSPTTREDTMTFTRYRIRLVNDEIASPTRAWSMVASTPHSAWMKFITQYFGVLKPQKEDYRVDVESSVTIEGRRS